ncbi:hypothetical protein DNTS_011659 [Danionella cerebrum]|uniref:Serine protease n=1 Tax=Danionella cerebrum TaxID=2873325 RepID=A0A553P146_9TELE|nr:hypothetical protein DNTS_011659 [Danionella translucida]
MKIQKMGKDNNNTIMRYFKRGGQKLPFCFRITGNSSKVKSGVEAVEGDQSKTVFDALKENKTFKKIMTKNKDKEMVIERSKGHHPRAAIKPDFPCCLIEKDELLDISFVKREGPAPTKIKIEKRTLERNHLVTFAIKTTGGDRVKRLMKNNALRRNLSDVSVYAFNDEKLKSALRNDGRFNNIIFTTGCKLYDLETEREYELSHTVEHLDGKHFKVIARNETPVSSLEDVPGDEFNEACSEELKENQGANLDSTEARPTEKSRAKKAENPYKQIPDSEETLKYLRAQFPGLLDTLLERLEKRKTKAEVQKVFREEYDKSVQSFSEVFKVKNLMTLSNSVCQIRREGSAVGSGFLLYGRFILTNAHVVHENIHSGKLIKKFQAVFDYEHLNSKTTEVQIKDEVPVYGYRTDAQQRFDFALLELDAAEFIIEGRKELLELYHGYPPHGSICIVGHPEGGIKRMDPCSLIGQLQIQEAVDQHKSENDIVSHMITKKSIEENWKVYDNQINYHSCFFHGSSGSPVFDEDCKLIGVHTGGYVYEGKENKIRSIVEYCYHIRPILEKIRAEAKIKGLNEIVDFLQKYTNENNNNQPHNNSDVVMEEV